MSNLNQLIEEKNIKAFIFDMDGVITKTAVVHAEAWKRMCDAYLKQRSEQDGKKYELFDVQEDYRKFVDGMPRLDGVRNFLKSRGITIPEGNPDDEAGTETVVGLGELKNLYFQEMLRQNGVVVFEDTMDFLQAYKRKGFPVAVISSSKNSYDILRSARIDKIFDARVDGVMSAELKLAGKPAPDIFLEAARRLNVSPQETAIFEDAQAGIEAGKAADFALVVGVDRGSSRESLEASGADVVINRFPNP